MGRKRLSHRALLLAGALILFLVGCDKPNAQLLVTCHSAQRWLSLSDGEFKRCLHEPQYRKDVETRRDTQYAEAITRAHNEHLALLEPRGYDPATFVVIDRMSELPVSYLAFEDKAKAHIGKRYVIEAKISVLGSSKPVFVKSKKDPGSGSSGDDMVGSDALNAYQKRFLSDHCFSSSHTSLCEGEVFLEIRQSVDQIAVRPEIVGARLKNAQAESVFEEQQETRRLAEAARTKKR